MPTTITAVILTLNEEKDLPDCLRSIQALTDRVLVVDSGSTDGTVATAVAHGCRVEQLPFNGYASQRNAALTLVDTEWTLFLDADERLRPLLVEEIQNELSHVSADVAGFWIPRRNRVLGRWLKGGGWWPDFQARLLRTGRVRYDFNREVHETVIFEGTSQRLKQAMIHINYRTPGEFLRKQRAYTRLRSFSDLSSASRKAYLTRPAREFWRRSVDLKGYRDGVTGLFLSAVLATEEARFVRIRRQQE